MKRWRIATEEEIISGRTTDTYFERTMEVLRAEGMDPIVHAEVTVSKIPDDAKWAFLAGVNDALKLFEHKNITVRGLSEGSLFHPRTHSGVRVPVLSIEGPYTEFAVLETPLLGFICYTSGLVTRTAQIRKAAGNKTLLSFGARRTHPAVTPQVEYAAYIGGCDGVSCVLGAEMLDLKPSGTMPHALVIAFQDLVQALRAFDRDVPTDIPRIAIADTYHDEVVEAVRAATAIKNLAGVRLDTTDSRRGDFRRIIEEVRWELDVRGFRDVKIYASGGLGVRELQELHDAPVDGFGVGGAISNSPSIDFAMDIVSIKEDEKWKPVAKRGKFSGRKTVWQCPVCTEMYVNTQDDEIPRCKQCDRKTERVTTNLVENGEILHASIPPSEIRSSILKQLAKVGGEP